MSQFLLHFCFFIGGRTGDRLQLPWRWLSCDWFRVGRFPTVASRFHVLITLILNLFCLMRKFTDSGGERPSQGMTATRQLHTQHANFTCNTPTSHATRQLHTQHANFTRNTPTSHANFTRNTPTSHATRQLHTHHANFKRNTPTLVSRRIFMNSLLLHVDVCE